MSLKAKIEAVIYTSEEPITLAQLAGLLGDEAQAELDALSAQQLELSNADDADALNAEVMDTSEVAAPEENAVILSEAERSGAESKDPDAAEATTTAETISAESPDKALSAAQKLAARRLRDYLRSILDQLIADYASSDRGLEIREVAGGYRLATKPEYHDAVRGFVKSLKPPLRLTLQALETLAVIAYKQPVTAPEISEIRGVDTSGVLGSLLTRKLIATAGRKQVIGRPILYKTSKEFLLRFGLKDLNELPSIEEFEKMAGELAEQEEIPMPEEKETAAEIAEERITHENLEEEAHATEPEADGDSDDLTPDDSNRPNDELPAVDGRLSGLPPREYVEGEDPSSDEAMIQESGGEEG